MSTTAVSRALDTRQRPELPRADEQAEFCVNEAIRPASPTPPHQRIRLAFLTTEYPKVSHTFIRREILALESLGYDIERFSVRESGPIADPADQEEAIRTTCLLEVPVWRHVLAFCMTVISSPLRTMIALNAVWTSWKVSDRTLLRHFAYLVEACTLMRLLAQRRVNHLHVHFGKNAADVARQCRILGGPPYSMMVHGPGEFDAPRSQSLREKVRDAAFTTAISDFARSQLMRWSDYSDWHRIHVVRCSVNDEFLECRELLHSETRTFVCVGRLTAQKGQLLLIDALAALIQRGQMLNLILAGDGEMRSVIDQRIRHHGIQDYVEITGWIGERQVRELILKSRALVLPSFAEGLPVVILEAFALGRTVISTAVAGIPEILESGTNGWLVNPGSIEGLIEAMQQCLETPLDKLNEMAGEGRRRVLQRHVAVHEARRLAGLIERFQTEPQIQVSSFP
jgi:colanic acid/amylovoran biosynthesis glycosyltransferase